MLAMLAAMLVVASSSPAQGEGGIRSLEGLEEFADGISSEFAALVEASLAFSELQSGLRRAEERAGIHQNHRQAYDTFRLTVERQWPFDDATVSEAQDNCRRAAEAFNEALRFEEQQYHTGRVTREAAVAAYANVADKFPGTVERDKVLHMAAHLYADRLFGDAKRDMQKAAEYFRLVTQNEGGPTAFTALAMENLASLDSDDTARMKDRSRLYDQLEAARSIEEAKKALLRPQAHESPSQFCKRVSETLISIRACQITDAKNMVADAAVSRNYGQNLKWLRERYADDAFVRGEVEVAIERAMRLRVGIKESDLDPMRGLEEIPQEQLVVEDVAVATEPPPTAPSTLESSPAVSPPATAGSPWRAYALGAVGVAVLCGLAVLMQRRSRSRH
ncbi:MAG: hypothetical protein JXL80_01845 [Planctomycetes bacterium]|nr:hypothetical protein [Planctomycetota bacterium]